MVTATKNDFKKWFTKQQESVLVSLVADRFTELTNLIFNYGKRLDGK